MPGWRGPYPRLDPGPIAACCPPYTPPLPPRATFVASCFIQACAGLAYSFSIYAPTMKDIMDLTQTEIGTVGSAVNLGGYFAVIAGSIYDRMEKEHQLGPR